MRVKEESRQDVRVIDETKWKTERGEKKAGQVTEASLIATQKKGRGFVSKNGHAGLFFESDLCSSLPPAAV